MSPSAGSLEKKPRVKLEEQTEQAHTRGSGQAEVSKANVTLPTVQVFFTICLNLVITLVTEHSTCWRTKQENSVACKLRKYLDDKVDYW